MSLGERLRRYDAARSLQVNPPSLEPWRRLNERLDRMADGLDRADLAPPPNLVPQCAKQLAGAQLPPRRLLKLLCLGGLRELDSSHHFGPRYTNRLLQMLGREPDRSMVKSLFIGYLRLARRDDDLTRRLQDFLVRHQDLLPQRWQRRNNDFDLLGRTVGAGLARGVHEGNDAAQLLRDAGLTGVLRTSDFARCVFEDQCERLSRGHHDTFLDQLFCLGSDDGAWFGTEITLYAKALLAPYVDGTSVPSAQRQQRIEQFLVKNYGDPRVEPRKWAIVPDELQAVLRGWLTRQSIKLLFEVLRQSNDTGQWKERHKFWLHYFENDYVTDAWVVFGRIAYDKAKNLIADRVIEISGSFGLLTGQAEPNHSMLLLKIGDVLVSEWTHSGKVRIIDKSYNPPIPLYKKTYSADKIRRLDSIEYNLRNAGHVVSPVWCKAHQGNWESVVANEITRRTRVPGP